MDLSLRQSEAIDQLRRVPFVTGLRSRAPHASQKGEFDGELEVRTPAGSFDLIFETKGNYLSRASMHFWPPPTASASATAGASCSSLVTSPAAWAKS